MLRALIAALLLLAGPALVQDEAREETAHQALDAYVPMAPVIVPGPNGPHLVYELHLTNFASATLTLERVDVTFQEGGSTFATYEGDGLERALGGFAPNRRVMAPGARVILYVRAPTNGIYEPPTIAHRMFYTREGETQTIIVGAADMPVRGEQTVPEIGPPLRGGPWVAVYGPDWERGHRRVVYAIEGRARVPGRFAIDYMRPGGADASGTDVLAVADGVVVAVRDEFPNDDPMPRLLGDATGNFVAIRIGRGRHAFYEHLSPDLPVSLGDRVRRGQVIGQIGATGAAPQPHLHFHLADNDSALQAEGIPYVMQYTPLGEYESIEAMNSGQPWREDGGLITPSFPAPMMVVQFPD